MHLESSVQYEGADRTLVVVRCTIGLSRRRKAVGGTGYTLPLGSRETLCDNQRTPIVYKMCSNHQKGEVPCVTD